jgi:hypothetical protein
VEAELLEVVLQRHLRRVERQLRAAIKAHQELVAHLKAVRQLSTMRGSRRTIRPSKKPASG